MQNEAFPQQSSMSNEQPQAYYPPLPPPYPQQPVPHPQQPVQPPQQSVPPYAQQSQAYYPQIQQPYMQPMSQYSQQPYPGQPYAPPMPQYMQQPYMQQPLVPQAYYPPQPAPIYTNVNVNVQRSGPGFLVRALYFLFIGWWLGLFWLNVGFGLCAFIITLPLGLVMLNRLPQIMTLRSPGTSTRVNVSTLMQSATPNGPAMMVNNVNISVGETQQHNFFVRALYFLLVGCWAGYLWANLAYLCCVSILLLPLGVMMFDRLPMVLTLRRN